MPYYQCVDESGGAAEEPDADTSDAEADDGEDSDSGSDSNFDYKSYLGENGSNSNSLGLSLGADDYIAKLDELQADVDRYSPRDYADSVREPAAERPRDIPYTGAPDLPLRRLDIFPDKLTIPLGVGSLDLRFTPEDYGIGLKFGGSISLDAPKPDVEWTGPVFEGTGRTGVFLNLDNFDKSNVDVGVGIKAFGFGTDVIKDEYTFGDVKKDIQTIYDGAVHAIGYPSSGSNPW